MKNWNDLTKAEVRERVKVDRLSKPTLAELEGRQRALTEISKGEFVYFVLAPKSNMIKIGKARNVKTRLSGIQTGCPEVVKLMLILCPPVTEQNMHTEFACYREHGEWFRYAGKLQKFVESERTKLLTPEEKRVFEETNKEPSIPEFIILTKQQEENSKQIREELESRRKATTTPINRDAWGRNPNFKLCSTGFASHDDRNAFNV